jgi:phage shock protein PspC (stress-responsive transcriptional regulator)
MFGGVCGGLSEYFKMDVTLIRLLWAAAVFLGLGAGIIFYLLCWIIIPQEPFYTIS